MKDRTGLYVLVFIILILIFITYIETREHLKEMMKLIRDINYETYNEKVKITNYKYQAILYQREQADE